MKRKRLALLLAVAMTITSIDSTAMAVSAAEFTADPVVEEAESETEAEATENPETEEMSVPSAEETSEDTADIELSDGDTVETEETTDSPEIVEEDDSEETAEEAEFTSEEISADVVADGEQSVVPDEGISEMAVDGVYSVEITKENSEAWFSFTPEEDGVYEFYSTGGYDTVGYFFDSREYYNELTDYRDDEHYNDDDGPDSNFKFSKELNAGTTYYYCAKMYDSDNEGTFDVKLVKERKVQSIQAALNHEKVVAGADRPLTAELQYIFTDGSTAGASLTAGQIWRSESYDFTGYSSTGIRIKKSDSDEYENYDGGGLSVGSYKVVFCWNDMTSNELDLEAVDVEDSSAFYGDLQEGDNPGTRTPEREYAYYRFVPSVTGAYNFRNINNRNIYTKSEDGTLTPCYDSKLTAGTAYYLQLWGLVFDSREDGTEYTNLNIQRRLAPANISFIPQKTEIYDRNSVLYEERRIYGKLTVTYDDGSIWEKENIECTNGCWDDDYSNYISMVIENEDGSTVDSNDSLEAGNYTAYLQYQGEEEVRSTPFTLTVKAFSIETCPQLAVGNNRIKLDTWYVFKPETTGTYDINHTSGWAPTWRYVNDKGDITEFDDEDDFYEGKVLAAGRTYLVYFNKGNDSIETEYDCVITRIASPVKVTVTSCDPSVDKLVFVEGIEEVRLDNIEAEVIFDDGSKTTVTDNDPTDDYGRDLRYKLMKKDESGNYIEQDWDEIPAGDYVYRVSYGRESENVVYADDIPVKVISLEEAEKTELKTETQNVQNKNGRVVLAFRPEESGRYEISFNVPISDVRMYDASGNSIRTNDADGNYAGVEREGYAIYATLLRDTSYYIRVEADEKYRELKMITSLLTRLESMKSKAYKTSYLAGVEDFDADTMETEITYPDNTTRKVRNQEETNGYYLQYKAVRDDGKTVYNGEGLSSGEWEVTPYLSASAATGSAVAVDIQAEGTRITAEKPDLSKYPVIAENTETTVNAMGRTIYSFRAEQDAAYFFETEGYGTVWFYRDGEEALSCTYGSIELKAGETCGVIADLSARSSELKFKIKKEAAEDVNPDENPITGETLALSPGMKSLIKLEAAGTMDCTFTPDETEHYVIWSEYNKNTEVDPEVKLYDDAGNECSSNYTGWNFRLVYELEKGKTYHYKVSVGSEAASFYLGFDKIKLKEIKNIELQAKEGKDPAEFSILDNDFSDYFERKITYTDDSVEILEWNRSEDAHENEIIQSIDTDNTVEDKELIYTIEFSYRRQDDSDFKDIPQKYTVKRKGFAGLEQITEGNAQKLPKGSEGFIYKQFAFQAPETGEYIVQMTGQTEETASAEINRYRRAYGYSIFLYPMAKSYEADGTYSFQLEKGKWYILDASVMGEDQDVSVTINRTKDIKTLELVKAPEQTGILPNDVNAISLKGMEVKAVYTDGSEENVVYGAKDSSGRYLQHNGVKWINAEKCRVYVRLGKYQVSFDVNAASWDDVRELKLNQETKLTAYKGDMLTLKLNVTEDALYTVDVNGGYVESIADAQTGKTTVLYENRSALKKDTLYYVHIHAFTETPTVLVKQGECKWEKTSSKEATCTADGFITETCSVHGEVRTEIIPKLGHNLGNRQTVKAATCGAAGESARICSRCKGKFEKQTIKATGKHKYGSWKTKKEATALTEGQKERICTVCKKAKQTQKIAKLKATLKLSVAAKKTLSLKLKRSYKVSVQMTKGDRVVSWKSSNPKAVTVDKYGKITGKQAGKTAKITVKLKSGLTTWFNVKVQKKDVATTSLKLKNASSGKYMANSVTLKRKQKLKVTPVIAPVTSTQKVIYTTSNEKVATVASNGQITAKRKGTAYITAKSGRKSVKIKVTVK